MTRARTTMAQMLLASNAGNSGNGSMSLIHADPQELALICANYCRSGIIPTPAPHNLE